MKDKMVLDSELDVGNTVVCDLCNDDFTDSDEKGGYIFGSKAVCPHCAEKTLKSIKKYHEEKYITSKPKANQSFKDFILKSRHGDNKIRIYSYV
jgi:hypothetical protein